VNSESILQITHSLTSDNCLGDFLKRISHQRQHKLLPCACELNRDIYFQKSPYTDSPLVLYNAECKSGGVQKLSGAVFCTSETEKSEIKLDRTAGKSHTDMNGRE